MPPRHAIIDAGGPVAFAHRGGAALFPENTLFAFEQAVAMGIRALELDVRVTRDGKLVVLHDATVDRTTSGSGRISGLSLAEAQRLDAGHRFTFDGSTRPFRGQGIVIPTFEEVVRALPDAAFNVELKVHGGAELLLAVIAKYDLCERIVVAAHHHGIMADFRRRGSDVATSASRREVLAFRAVSALGRPLSRPRFRALQIPVSYRELPLITARTIRLAHQMDVRVHAWTIDNPERMRTLFELGVDGIMTDRPDVLLRVLGVPATAVSG